MLDGHLMLPAQLARSPSSSTHRRLSATRRGSERRRQLLRACTPEAVADEWLDEYDHQNALLTECGDEPLWATEFIQCRIEDLMEG